MKSLPHDWDTETTMPRGVSRNNRHRGYMVALLLNKRQVFFGPFRESRSEASTAHDRLLRYFLPFAKRNAAPNCPGEVFIRFVRSETEEMYGEKKLQGHYDRLQKEAEAIHINVPAAEAERMKYIREGCGLHERENRLIEARDKQRRLCLGKLECMAMIDRMPRELDASIAGLSIPKEKITTFMLGKHAFVLARYADAHAALVEYIKDIKVALDMDPNTFSK